MFSSLLDVSLYSAPSYSAPYLSIFSYFSLATAIALLVFGLSFFLGYFKGSSEKYSTYECGFEPFSDTKQAFSVKFYIVAVLFIIFDLEVSFLYPWAVFSGDLTRLGFWSMFFFLLILTIGFAIEWLKGGMDWES